MKQAFSAKQTDYDVVVIGAGIVGLTFAVALKQHGLNVAIIEQQSLPQQQASKIKFSKPSSIMRVSALNRVAENILASLNVWQKLPEKNYTAYHSMQVWDSSLRGEINFSAQQVGQSNLGHIVENSALHQTLLKEILDHNISFFHGVTPIQLIEATEYSELVLSDQRILKARLFVGADGSNSWLREEINISCHRWSYQQSALVTTVRTKRSHQQRAWQQFMPTGILAFLPLANSNSYSIVWSTTTRYAQQLKGNQEQLEAALNQAYAKQLGEIKLVQPIALFPLMMQHAKTYYAERAVLIGDAAHTIHPLAGQGLSLGLMDVACLAEVISNAWNKKRDIGSHVVLAQYQRWRKRDNWAMIAFLDVLKQLFSTTDERVVRLRNWGLNSVDQWSVLKRWLIRQALGLTDDLPALAKKEKNSSSSPSSFRI